MVVVFLAPVLAGVGLARCAPLSFYLVAVLTVVPFVDHSGRAGLDRSRCCS